MPAHGCPQDILEAAQTFAEIWLFDVNQSCILTEWVSRAEADDVMDGLLWRGFCLRGQPNKRIAPKPVFLRVLYTQPHPVDVTELRERMQEYFIRAVREWIQALQQYGNALGIAP